MNKKQAIEDDQYPGAAYEMLGGLVGLAGAGLACPGLVLLIIGSARMINAKSVVGNRHPYMKHYASSAEKRLQLSAIGVTGTPRSAMVGATLSF